MKKCKVEGCNLKYYAVGYCSRHWKQLRRYGVITCTNSMEIKRFECKENICLIYTYNRKYECTGIGIIDIEDYDKIKNYNWALDKDAYLISKDIDNKMIKLHRIILNAPSNKQVDHKDRNPLNNKKDNLRLCDSSQNAFNKKTTNTTSGIKGVYYNKKRNKWETSIYYKGEHIFLGCFDNSKEAALAYNEAAKKYAKSFARLNTI